MKALKRSSNSSSSNQPSSSPPASSWIHLRWALLIVAPSSVPERGSLKSPWSQRKRKRTLTHQYWNGLFTPEGKLCDGGYKFLKKARSGGIDPSIRSEVWPFLLGVYDLNSSEQDRNAVKMQKRKEYENLRLRCCMLSDHFYQGNSSMTIDEICNEMIPEIVDHPQSPKICKDNGTRIQLSMEKNGVEGEEEEKSGIDHIDVFHAQTDSSDSESSVEESQGVIEADQQFIKDSSFSRYPSDRTVEDFATWWRIIRLDAIRANAEWVIYSPGQAAISEEAAVLFAQAVQLKDYDHLEPFMIHHAARLVSVLESYAIYDPEIGYCQGMSDLLAPILTVMDEDHEAFWCFAGFMRKARHNFRLDEVGIRRQLSIVSRIIRSKDAQFYGHLKKLQAEDCFFVYRMVVVLFRRELTFEQTVRLWEVMWADQAAIRAGLGRSAWGRIRPRAPPTDDLLLYAIAACVLRRRKLIIERYSSMDEIMRECNSMAGQLDVWKLLDDAHDLVVTLHDKI